MSAEATRAWLNEVGLELPKFSHGEAAKMKKIRQLTDVGRFLNRLLGKTSYQYTIFIEAPNGMRFYYVFHCIC